MADTLCDPRYGVTIHVLGMPHTAPTKAWSHCAFTDRTRVFAAMMPDTILYPSTPEERKHWWPDYDGTTVFNDFNPNSLGWREFNARCTAEIRERVQSGDILAITMGLAQKPVADALADTGIMVVEVGIGYSGVWAPYRVFESRAWMDFLAAKEPRDDMRAYDEVIPRAWETGDFPLGAGKGDYVLFVGRMMARKGPHIAAEAAKRAGVRIVFAGQGVASSEPGRIICDDGMVLEGDVEYAGIIDPEERAKLMGDAIAVLVPTQYFEPLGGVSIESQLTGTPAIVADYGGLVENVIEGETGFRCRMLRDYVRAIEQAPTLDRKHIREHAIATWSTDAIRPRFTAHLGRLQTLYDKGWYSE